MDLRELKLKTKFELTLPFKTIESCYKDLCRELNLIHRDVIDPTIAENLFAWKLIKKTRLKVYRRFWIGGRNVDLFCPSIGGYIKQIGNRRMRGVAIEVDGWIHNKGFKIKKDEDLLNLLYKLNVGLMCVQNDQIGVRTIRTFLDEVSKLPRLDSRARKRVLRDIYLLTIAKHRDFDSVKTNLNQKQLDLVGDFYYQAFRGLK